MKVLIFSAFEPLPSDGIAPIRYARIAEEFLLNGHEVVFIAPTFFHLHKKQRPLPATWNENENPPGLELKLISAPSYISHSGIKRLLSHYILARNLKRYLRSAPKPDIVITAYPPVTANYYLAKWCVKNSIPYIADVQDVWPLSFEQLLPVPRISKSFLKTLKQQFEYVTKNAKVVVPVSADFIQYISIKKNALCMVFHLGTDTSLFPRVEAKDAQPVFKLLYVGNASTNNVLQKAITAVSKIHDAELTVIGLKNASAPLEEYCKTNNITNVKFIPWLPYNELSKIAVEFDAGLLLINKQSYIFLPNKAITYFAAGLPVINNICDGELEEIIRKNDLGITIKYDNEAFIADAIYALRQNYPAFNRQKIQQFAIENFDSQSIYRQYYIWVMQVFSGNA